MRKHFLLTISFSIVILVVVLFLSLVVYRDYEIKAFIEAARNGDTEHIRNAIEKDINVNAKTYSDYTALMAASYNGHIEIVEILIENKVDVNAKDNSDKTALMWASSKGHTEIVELLKEAGATE